MKKYRVCVIGAGPSGITAVKNLLDKNIEVIAYDRNKDAGGNWIFSEDESHSSVFETTHIISSKTLSQYEDFTFDDFEKGIPDYPSHDQLRRYFQAYCKHFELYPHIQFETMVLRCALQSDGNWAIDILQNGARRTEVFSHLVVCNGHHWKPRFPEFPGQFDGTFIHSHAYKKAAQFADQKVLVIGGGNSACDVAVETSRVSKRTVISWRRGYRIVPKFFFGRPSDVVASDLKFLPVGLRNWLSQRLIRIMVGSNKWYGLQKPSASFGSTHPVINDELLYKLRHGKVFPKPNIDRFDGKQVHFTDGSVEEFDTIIACTGFVLSHPFFDKNFIDYSEGEVPLYLRMFHPSHANLFFVGMIQPLGCIWPIAELQSKLVAQNILGKWKRPENIKALCDREVTKPHMQQIKTARHTITVDFHFFMKQLRRELPRDYVSKKLREIDVIG